MAEYKVTGLPSWMRQTERRGKLRLIGNKGWAGQPVVNRVRIRGGDDINKVFIDRAMMASWRFKGKGESRDRIIFGGQAGAISKRANSVIDFGRDQARDVFQFSNTTREHGPFNHMQRFVIRNFGREDVVQLKNIGQTFRFRDLRPIGGGDYGFPGVPATSLRVQVQPGLL